MKYIIIVLVAVLCISTWALPQDAGIQPQPSPELYRIDPKTPEGLQELLKYTGAPLHVVSAHRGGPRKGFPENCLATFENTLQYTFSMLEIDPRYTKDGHLVLHHDATLERTTNGKGLVADFTLQELKQLHLKDPEGNLTEYSIPTLDEALQWARGKTILVLDQKKVPLQDRIRKIEEHNAEAYAILIISNLEEAKSCYAMNKHIMMEMIMTSREKVEAFEQTGVPWSNIVAFVGHSPPRDAGLNEIIHTKGARCMAGSSRNIDLQFIKRQVAGIDALRTEYSALIDQGVDIIETDLPREVGRLLYEGNRSLRQGQNAGDGVPYSTNTN
jgi:glycerophosphoryl diester phosphodiesterase